MAHRTILLAISGQSSSRTESYFKIWSTSKNVFCSAWSEHCIYYYYLNHIQLDIAWIVRAHQNLMIHAKPYRIAVILFSNILHSTFSELAIDRMFPIRGFKYPKTRFYLVYLPCSSIYQSSTCFLIMDHNWFYNLSFIILSIGAMKTAVLFCIKLLKTFPWKCVIIYSHGILFINFIFNKQTKCLFISAKFNANTFNCYFFRPLFTQFRLRNWYTFNGTLVSTFQMNLWPFTFFLFHINFLYLINGTYSILFNQNTIQFTDWNPNISVRIRLI